jgi:hypothetical protein
MKQPKDVHHLAMYWATTAMALGLAVIQIFNFSQVVPW